ncbi:MAG TPA: FKBP-type peptidyl-prolyl cis-trans isomerase [Caulobacteraceae bacterium]|jgi:peptidylprolyl isomerase/FKBP-type peptidyl-prolyl cis-trans isomerase FklB|nr:FKBP-type peptidyl-prolyl cis-trans isomerase [Caulobacteraceae bacterium]
MVALRLALVLAFSFTVSACADPRAAQDLAQANAFLATNAKAEGVITLRSGLQYKVLQAGPAGGASPLSDDRVLVNYEGKLLDGTVFDSSYPRGRPDTFVVGQLIPAWTEALQKMKPGDVWMLYAPPKLAYGVKGAGPIPPNSALIFKIELIGILPRDASVGNG